MTMLNYKKLNILFFSALAVLVILGFFTRIVLLPYLILTAIYLTMITVGAFSIRMNFFFTSLHAGASDKHEVALTFDDGPHPEITPKVLDILDKYEIKASFFCIGSNADQYPELVTSISKKNHIIANHSFTHHLFFDFFRPGRMVKELEKTNEVLFHCTGKKTRLFRPPFGVTNPSLKKALKTTGLISVGWSVRSLDTMKPTEKVLAQLKKKTRPGAVILLHDSHEKIIPILNSFLPWLKENGYRVSGLDKLLNIQAYEHA